MLLMAGCTAGDGDRTQPATSGREPSASTTEPDLGDAKPSGVEELPVPASASLSDGGDCVEASCREQRWTVPGASPGALRSWYVEHLDPTKPWRGWEPCFSGDTAVELAGMGTYQWHRTNMHLVVLVSGDQPNIDLRLQPGEMPCQ